MTRPKLSEVFEWKQTAGNSSGICFGDYPIGVDVMFSNGWHINFFGTTFLAHTQTETAAKEEAIARFVNQAHSLELRHALKNTKMTVTIHD